MGSRFEPKGKIVYKERKNRPLWFSYILIDSVFPQNVWWPIHWKNIQYKFWMHVTLLRLFIIFSENLKKTKNNKKNKEPFSLFNSIAFVVPWLVPTICYPHVKKRNDVFHIDICFDFLVVLFGVQIKIKWNSYKFHQSQSSFRYYTLGNVKSVEHLNLN